MNKAILIVLPEENGRLPLACELAGIGFGLSAAVAVEGKRNDKTKLSGGRDADESGENGDASETGQE